MYVKVWEEERFVIFLIAVYPTVYFLTAAIFSRATAWFRKTKSRRDWSFEHNFFEILKATSVRFCGISHSSNFGTFRDDVHQQPTVIFEAFAVWRKRSIWLAAPVFQQLNIYGNVGNKPAGTTRKPGQRSNNFGVTLQITGELVCGNTISILVAAVQSFHVKLDELMERIFGEQRIRKHRICLLQNSKHRRSVSQSISFAPRSLSLSRAQCRKTRRIEEGEEDEEIWRLVSGPVGPQTNRVYSSIVRAWVNTVYRVRTNETPNCNKLIYN